MEVKHSSFKRNERCATKHDIMFDNFMPVYFIISTESDKTFMDRLGFDALVSMMDDLEDQFEPMMVIERLKKVGVLNDQEENVIVETKDRNARIKLFVETLRAKQCGAFDMLLSTLSDTGIYGELTKRIVHKREYLVEDWLKEGKHI